MICLEPPEEGHTTGPRRFVVAHQESLAFSLLRFGFCGGGGNAKIELKNITIDSEFPLASSSLPLPHFFRFGFFCSSQ
jgi:hypothetical protein